jgi:hypothetical protein
MKFLISSLLTLILLMTASFAQVINSEFKPSPEYSSLKEGDIFEATISFWPLENADLLAFRSLDKTTLFDAFFMTEIISLAPSPNNADVIELKAAYLIQSATPQLVYTFNYKGAPVEVRLGNVKIQPLEGKTAEYIILDQTLIKKTVWKIIIGILVLLALVAFFQRAKINNLIQRIRRKDEKANRDRFQRMFKSASIREDFELIYKEKDIWQKYLEVITPAHRDFFKVMNTHQYKRFWSNEDVNEVKFSFETIRRSFDK